MSNGKIYLWYVEAQIHVKCLEILLFGKVAEEVLVEKGLYDTMMFSSSGPAGVFGLYVMPGMNLFRVFVNEFVMVTTEIQPEYTTCLTIIS
jgi:hypothetical protein